MTPPLSSPNRERYAPALRQLMERLDGEGLTDVVRRGRAESFEQISALAGCGLVSSSSIRVGEDIWRLHFTRVGRALRKLLLAEAARA